MNLAVHRERFAVAARERLFKAYPAFAPAPPTAFSEGVVIEEDSDTKFLRWIVETLTELNPENFTREDAIECSAHVSVVLVAIQARLARR